MRPSALFVGVPVDDVTLDEAVDEIARLVVAGRRDGKVGQVVTVNLDFVTNAIRSADVMHVLQRAALSIADGKPIVWGARLLRTPLRERVAGADLLPAVVARGAAEGWTVYLFGGARGAAEQVAEQLTRDHPGVTVLGDSQAAVGPAGEVDDGVLDLIAASRADVLCVALGNPKQERFIERYGERLGIPVAIGVGGTLDFLIGLRKRAPSRAQGLGLEWVFRMLQEPKRLGPRYARDIVVTLPRFGLQFLRSLRPRPSWAPAAIVERADGILVTARGSLDLRRDRGLAALQPRGRPCVVDVSDVSRPDVGTVAALVSVRRASGVEVEVRGVGTALRRRITAEGAERVLPRAAGGRAAM